MVNHAINFILISLLIFTPIAFASMDFWAFSLMELGILFMIILWAIRFGLVALKRRSLTSEPKTPNSELRIPNSQLRSPGLILLALFLCLIIFQMIPLPSGVVKILSPKNYELRNFLVTGSPAPSSLLVPGSSSRPSALGLDSSPQPSAGTFFLSLVPFATQVEFFKWLTLIGFFLFLQVWSFPENRGRTLNRLILVIFLVGVFESLYGMFESFSGHHQALNIKLDDSSVAGTFISRNYFAGYLLMVIPLSIGYLLSREENQILRFRGWRHWLTSLHGKSLLVGFGVVVMILSLLFSASRMGIASLLFSCGLISLLLRSLRGGKKVSRIPVLILVLALLWAAWIGLDAVISRFFTSSDDFKSRWEVWVDTVRMVKDFPLFGSGLGTFTLVFPMYRSFHITGVTNHAENDFLQLASDVGLLGIGLLLILFIAFFYKAVEGIRSLSGGDPKRYVGIGGLVGIVALMLHSLVEANVQVPANAFLFAFIFAVVLRLPDVTHQRN
jgi:putative inorganic carbon (HCO3(-)) transporter